MEQAAVLPTLPAAARKRFAPFHRWDRNFFLLIVGAIWVGVLMGFVPQMYRRAVTHAHPYPLIVHFHAAAMVGWLVLLTTQVLLIRSRRLDLHRSLGVLGGALAVAMVVLGPATALVVQQLAYRQTGAPPVFLAVQFTDILAFGGLVTAGLVWRTDPSAHKRLLLLATLYITDAGFVRWLADPLQALLGQGLFAQFATYYLMNDLVVLAMGGYDLATRGRLHPAYVAGVAWTGLMQSVAVTLLLTPRWAPVALHLIGH
jgi:hypothetical protein